MLIGSFTKKNRSEEFMDNHLFWEDRRFKGTTPMFDGLRLIRAPDTQKVKGKRPLLPRPRKSLIKIQPRVGYSNASKE